MFQINKKKDLKYFKKSLSSLLKTPLSDREIGLFLSGGTDRQYNLELVNKKS